MPIKVSIDTTKNLVYRELHGRVSTEEIIESIESVIKDPNFHPGMKSLTDLRYVTHQADSADVMRVAEAILKYSDKLESGKVAVVVLSEVVYGMMRMLQSYTDESPLEIMVFKDFDEAMNWLET